MRWCCCSCNDSEEKHFPSLTNFKTLKAVDVNAFTYTDLNCEAVMGCTATQVAAR